MNKKIDPKIQSGPCVVCGETDYPLSMGGPSICPACDMGQDLKTRLGRYRDLITGLEAEIEWLKKIIEEAISQHHRVAPNTIMDGVMRKYEALKGKGE